MFFIDIYPSTSTCSLVNIYSSINAYSLVNVYSFAFVWLTRLRTSSLGCRLTVYLLHFVHAAAMLVLGATLPISLFYQVLWGLVGGPALTNVSTAPHRTFSRPTRRDNAVHASQESIVNFLSTPTREMDEPHLVPEPMNLRELDVCHGTHGTTPDVGVRAPPLSAPTRAAR